MSIDSEVDPRRRLITIALRDVVSGRMLSDLQHRLQNDARIEEGFDQLVDLSPAWYLDLETPVDELQDLVISETTDPTPCRIALVMAESRDGMFLKDVIIPRMRPLAEVRVFEKKAEALGWLQRPG
jgi:hypothetical protein